MFVLGVLASTAGQEKTNMKDIKIEIRETKLSFDDLMVYLQIPKEAIKPWGLISEFSKISEYKVNTQKSGLFLHICAKHLGKKCF